MNTVTNTEKLLVELGKSRTKSLRSWAVVIITYVTIWACLFKPLKDQDLDWIIIILGIPILVIGLMIFINQKTMLKEIKLINNIIRERYFENFIKTKQSGDNPIDKFISIAKEVFPQVNIATSDDSSNIVKTKSGKDIIINKKRNIIFQKVISQKIIVEEILDSLTIEKLKQIKQQSFSDKIFRYVIICWDLEECINSDEFEKIMKNTLNIDIFSYKDEFLSIEWIS